MRASEHSGQVGGKQTRPLSLWSVAMPCTASARHCCPSSRTAQPAPRKSSSWIWGHVLSTCSRTC
eukprot:3256498-Rhodomonas_salina.1